MPLPKFRYPAAIVVWLDAHARNQAVEFEESEVVQVHRPEECQILGLVIKDDEAGVSLFSEQTGSTSIRGLSFIPRGMIKAVYYVNLTQPRTKPCAASSSPSSPASASASPRPASNS